MKIADMIGRIFSQRPRLPRAKSFQAPDFMDETIWTGSPSWGEGTTQRLSDPWAQVMQHRSWVYVCNNYNGKSVASVPLRLYVTKSKGQKSWRWTETKKLEKRQEKYLSSIANLQRWVSKAEEVEEITEHNFLDMLWEVNSVMNQFDFWFLSETYMGLTGNSYWWIRENRIGVPFQLWPLESYRMKPVPGSSADEIIKGYVYTRGFTPIPFGVEEILHFKYPNPYSKIVGLSPVMAMSDPILINMEMNKYDRAVFRNQAFPAGTVETDQQLDEDSFERIKKNWTETYGGSDKAGKVALLDFGLKFKRVTMTPKELNHLEGRKMTREEVAAGFGINMALLSPTDANRAVAEVAYAQYMRDTVTPKLRMYEQKMNEVVLPRYDERLFCAFDDAVPENVDMRLKQLDARLKNAYSSINQERQEDGLDEVDWGDVPILPMGMMSFGSAPPVKEEKATKALAKAVAEEIFARIK